MRTPLRYLPYHQITLRDYSSITNNVINHLLDTYYLDHRERQVFALLIAGCSDQDIADHFGFSRSWASELVYRIIHKGMNTDGGRGGFFRVIFEEVDSILRYEDVLIKQQKEKLGIQC